MIDMQPTFNTFVKLGTNSELSKLELSSMLEDFSIEEIKFFEWKKYLLLNLSKEIQTQLIKSLDKSGSVIKVGLIEIEEKIKNLDKLKSKLSSYFTKTLKSLPIKKSRKIKFALNIQITEIEKRKKINHIIKNTLSQVSSDLLLDIKIRSPKKESAELSPFQFFKENFHKRGFEITCLAIKSKVFIGHVKWVTNPLKDIKQDEERPVRFFSHGTSIKLARTMVNLSKIEKGDILFDPFCGTGTILIEGLKQDLHVIGIDKDPKCVRASKANLNNFSMKFPAKEKMKDKWSIYLLDSQNLNQVLDKEIGGLVTEPYLGPFIKDLPAKNTAKDTMIILEKLYTKVLQRSSEYLKIGARIIFIIPEYRYSPEYSISPDFEKIGLNCGLNLQSESTYFNVKLPVKIGRRHNIINRNLVIYIK
jgi:tRNA G10  N-methylase Trm11